MNIIILNGPPSSGKDFIADRLVQLSNTRAQTDKLSLATPIKQSVHKALGIETFGEGSIDVEKLKDTPLPEFYGKTPREAYIEFSEQYMKPMYGNDIFGKLMVKQLRLKEKYKYKAIVISDAGFSEELVPILDAYPDSQVVRVYRDGCNFNSDSRSYLPPTMNTHSFENKYSCLTVMDAMLRSLFIPYLTEGDTRGFSSWLLANNKD